MTPSRRLQLLYQIETAWERVTAAAMFVIMLTFVTDAFGRYVFNTPIPWAYDFVSRLLLPATFFFALSSTLRENQHVNIDVLYQKLSMRAKNIANMVGSLLAAGLFFVIGALGARTTYQAYLTGEKMSGAIEWPVWFYAAFIPLGVFPLVIRLAIRAHETWLRARRGESAPDWQPGKNAGAESL
jgi:TRAP-type C4-dicarboxylate transport system permease small subunit